jgi:hypothetical protein
MKIEKLKNSLLLNRFSKKDEFDSFINDILQMSNGS